MQNRREFLKTAAFAALGSGMAINGVLASERVAPALFSINKSGVVPRMKLRFFPYELKLRHVFTVAAYSRTTTPDVQVEIEYDGIIGYGEASMPPYLQHELGTMDSVLAFLKKVQDVIGQFTDPFRLEDILGYIDTLSVGDAAAKQRWISLCMIWWVNCCRLLGIKYGDWTGRKHLLPHLPLALTQPM